MADLLKAMAHFNEPQEYKSKRELLGDCLVMAETVKELDAARRYAVARIEGLCRKRGSVLVRKELREIAAILIGDQHGKEEEA